MILNEECLKNKYQWRMTAENVGFVMGPVIQPAGYTTMITPRQVIATVANIVSVKSQVLLGKNKAHHISHARQIAMVIVRDNCPSWSHSAIGRHFGQHHTTVLYGIEQGRRRIRESKVYREIYVKACRAMKIPPIMVMKS